MNDIKRYPNLIVNDYSLVHMYIKYAYYTTANSTFGISKLRYVRVPSGSIRMPPFITREITAACKLLFSTIFV